MNLYLLQQKRIFGFDYNISTNNTDYKELMQFIFKTGITLDEFVSVPQDYYERIRKKVNLKSKNSLIFEMISSCVIAMVKFVLFVI